MRRSIAIKIAANTAIKIAANTATKKGKFEVVLAACTVVAVIVDNAIASVDVAVAVGAIVVVAVDVDAVIVDAMDVAVVDVPVINSKWDISVGRAYIAVVLIVVSKQHD